jgi:hypothetical protein
MSDPLLAFRYQLRQRLERQLADAGLLLPLPDYYQLRQRIMAEGTRQWHRWLRMHPAQQRRWRPLALYLNLQVQTIPRVLGFGALQTEALARAFSVPAGKLELVAELGALFNLGIVLFDWLIDHDSEHDDSLRTVVSPDRLEALLDGRAEAPLSHELPAIDFLLAIISHFCRRCGVLEAELPTGRALRDALETMYAAEVDSSCTSLIGGESAEVQRKMWAKSVLPVWTMALAGLHQRHPSLTQSELQSAQKQVFHLGELLWLIDDIVDVVDDWETGNWNRLWHSWHVEHGLPPALPTTGEAAVQALEAGNVLGQAIEALLATWGCVEALFPAENGNDMLQLCWRATIQSWVRGLPA